MKNVVKIWNLGTISYSRALKIQQSVSNLHFSNENGSKDTLLILEHPPVYTTGIRTKEYTEEEANRLRQTGAEFYRTNRGGLITFHGPGQLIVYPIINLKNYKTSMRWFVCNIEKTIINLCRKVGLEANTSPHTGVWIGDNKVCAIGLHGSRFITTHGLALNCSVDLKWFDHIVPCGIEDKGVTSISKELNRNATIEEITPIFLNSFQETFNCTYKHLPAEEVAAILNVIKKT